VPSADLNISIRAQRRNSSVYILVAIGQPSVAARPLSRARGENGVTLVPRHSCKRFLVIVAESLEVGPIPWFMNIEDSNDQSGTLRVASNAARRLDILGTRFLADRIHTISPSRMMSRPTEIMLRGNGNVHAALIENKSDSRRSLSKTSAVLTRLVSSTGS